MIKNYRFVKKQIISEGLMKKVFFCYDKLEKRMVVWNEIKDKKNKDRTMKEISILKIGSLVPLVSSN